MQKTLHLSNTFIRWCNHSPVFHAAVHPKICRGSFGCSRGEANACTLTCRTCIYEKSTTMSELWNGGWSLEIHLQYTHYMYRLVLSWPWFRHSFFTVYMDSFLKWLLTNEIFHLYGVHHSIYLNHRIKISSFSKIFINDYDFADIFFD